MPANERIAEVSAIGRILSEYNNLEISLLHCVQMGNGDFNLTFKAMFGSRGEAKRISAARDLGSAAYQKLGLGVEFDQAIEDIRLALRIRNQYAHWTWWDDHSGMLAIANLEDLAADTRPVANFDNLRVSHVDMPLLRSQQEFFVYVDRYLSWLNFEGRYLTSAIGTRICEKPGAMPAPALYRA